MALQAQKRTTRQIAAGLGVSQPTVVRDLRAHREAEGEAVLAALAGIPPDRPRRLSDVSRSERAEIRRGRWKRRDEDGEDANWLRRYRAEQLREQDAGLREIARRLGVSPATVLRDLRHGTAGRAGAQPQAPRP